MNITAVKLSKQDCQDIIDCASDSGSIAYWIINYHVLVWRDDEGSIYKMIVEDSHTQKEYTINPSVIRLGVKLIVDNKNLAPYIRKQILNDDIDSDGADCIIQVGLFGEILYS